MARHQGRVQVQGRGIEEAASPRSIGCEEFESAVRAGVAERLGEQRFGLWFGEGVRLGLSGDGQALEIRVPDAFFRERIQAHFAPSLLDAARAVAGRALRLEFSIQGEAEPPLGDVVEPGDERQGSRPGVTIAVPGNPKAPLTPADSPSAPDRPRSSRLPIDFLTPPSASAPSPSRTTPPESRRPSRRLDDFVTGPSNRLAHAAAREMVHTGGRIFNPLVIHGGIGLGKTHLLEAIASGLRQARPGINLLSITAEFFTNGFLEAMRAGTLGNFRGRYRRIECLIVDDVHFLAAKKATQDEFLHTFNALMEQGAIIVLAADQHPRRIARLSDELATRFLGGMVVKLEAPDPTTRRAILQAKAQARGVSVPPAVLDYIAEHLRSSVRELEGALHSVIAHALLTGKRLDLALARVALRDTIRHTAQVIGLRDVERAVCQLFQIDAEELRSDSRVRAVAHPRMLAMYLARKHAGIAYSEIGRHFGGRNHSTVISAEKKVQGWLRDEQRNNLLPGFETMADVLTDLEAALGA